MENIEETIVDNKKYILAFGDSLTKGYYNYGRNYHPYAIKMNKLLEENNFNCKVIDSGLNGEVTKHMLDRIKSFFEGDNLIYKLSHVIIYAGANDLGYLSHDKIANNIIALHKYVLDRGVPTILITLPENKCDEMYDFYGEKRHKTNELLKEMGNKIENLTICDLDSLIKYKSMKKSDKKKYWDDHVHYTPDGYDLIGEILFNTIKNLL